MNGSVYRPSRNDPQCQPSPAICLADMDMVCKTDLAFLGYA